MPGLILKLRPNERFLVNGAALENGAKRTQLNILTPGSNVLRLRDAINPDQANTPVRRVCYIAQMVVAGEADPDEARVQLETGLSQLASVFTDLQSRGHLERARDALDKDSFYQALRSLRALMPVEDHLMSMAHMS
ncbi:MAG: flagellar biosynthesis repressor FlbT [Pseudomonadota bacterium]